MIQAHLWNGSDQGTCLTLQGRLLVALPVSGHLEFPEPGVRGPVEASRTALDEHPRRVQLLRASLARLAAAVRNLPAGIYSAFLK